LAPSAGTSSAVSVEPGSRCSLETPRAVVAVAPKRDRELNRDVLAAPQNAPSDRLPFFASAGDTVTANAAVIAHTSAKNTCRLRGTEKSDTGSPPGRLRSRRR